MKIVLLIFEVSELFKNLKRTTFEDIKKKSQSNDPKFLERIKLQ